jgi:hypothetical protein
MRDLIYRTFPFYRVSGLETLRVGGEEVSIVVLIH